MNARNAGARSKGKPDDDYRKKPRKPPPKPQFARLVVQARERIGLSQSELARAAGVSPRTVAQVEREGSARADVIIRLAVALSQPPKEWLSLAGHYLSDERIRNIQKQQQRENVTPPFLRLNPKTHFDRMCERIKSYQSALMCSLVTSNISIYPKELYDSFGEMFNAGLHLALVCPFPITDSAIILNRDRLARYYMAAYSMTSEAAQRLRERFSTYRDRISVFHPAVANGASLVTPPLRVTEIRPAFTVYGGQDPALRKYELGAYIKYLDGRDDQWLEIYSGDGLKSERTDEACEVWKDYCRDIIASWNPENAPYFDDNKLLYWQRMKEAVPNIRE
jgi:transcriptional regulator with XRE-family HTH domain